MTRHGVENDAAVVTCLRVRHDAWRARDIVFLRSYETFWHVSVNPFKPMQRRVHRLFWMRLLNSRRTGYERGFNGCAERVSASREMKQSHPVSPVSLVDDVKQPHPVSLVSFHCFTSLFHFAVSLVGETPPVSLVDGMKRFHTGVKQGCFIRCFTPARLARVAVLCLRESRGHGPSNTCPSFYMASGLSRLLWSFLSIFVCEVQS
jgi:hypothetical protein